MYDIDYTDSNALWKFSMETCGLAEKYFESRKNYALNLSALKAGLALAYAEGTIDKKYSESKAFMLLGQQDSKFMDNLSNMAEEENIFKGLEKVLEAREASLSFSQSIMRHTQKQGG